ncbi:uncharacterized protein LOC143301381 [Babylonia areolata]|uniref:uncharacterized protein LOC143301381 n=1 Tax=Babylonia areolata TaxID=304850 RepID=UPI003FCFA694
MNVDLKDLECLRSSHCGGGGATCRQGGRGAEQMGVYDHMMRPSMGHRMQVELRESMQHYHGVRTQLQEQLSELCFSNRQLYTSPHPPSPAPSNFSSSTTTSSSVHVKRWRDPDSKFSKAPEQAAQRARLANLQAGGKASGKADLPPISDNNRNAQTDAAAAVKEEVEPSGRRSNAAPLPPVTAHRAVSSSGGQEAPPEIPPALNDQPQPRLPPCSPTKEKTNDAAAIAAEKKALRFGANVELKTPLPCPKKPVANKGGPGTAGQKKGGGRRKSVLKDKATHHILKLPALHGGSLKSRRCTWDSGRNHLPHRKGKSTALEASRVKEECLTFSCPSLTLPAVADPKRTEVRRCPPLPQGLTKARLQAANRLHKRLPVAVMYTENSPANETPRAVYGELEEEEEHFVWPASKTFPELDDSGTVLTALEYDVEAGMDGSEGLAPLPVVRLSEYKGSGLGWQTSTRHVPRLRLDRAQSPGLVSVTTTGRSGATGFTGATYMSQETLEWKGEYMATGNRNRKDRMLSEIIQIVRQRMRENEEDLKAAGHYPRPNEFRSLDEEDDVTFWDRRLRTPTSETATARSTARRQRLRAGRTTAARATMKKQSSTAVGGAAAISDRDTRGGGTTAAAQSSGARLHAYLQKLSQRRKERVKESRPAARERVRFQLANLTIREITELTMSSRGQPSASLYTGATAATAH